MKRFKLLPTVVLVSAISVIAGCMGAQNHEVLNEVAGLVDTGTHPYVEAYIEYPGPHEKWAGPQSFILHVSARGAGYAEINASPSWFLTQPEKVSDRTLASADAKKAPVPAASASPAPQPVAETIPNGIAREKIAELATAIQASDDPKFKGCLSPVRVRVIRHDGAILEKTGCRNEKGWPGVAASSVNYFLTAAVYGPDAVKN